MAVWSAIRIVGWTISHPAIRIDGQPNSRLKTFGLIFRRIHLHANDCFSKNNGIIDRAMSFLPVLSPLIYAVHVKLDRVQSLVFRPRARGLADDLRCKVKGVFRHFPNNFSQCPCLSVQGPFMSG